MCAHGAKDDSDVVIESSLYRVDDLAELAARTGSIIRYRRGGNVLYVEDFSAGFGPWIASPLYEGVVYLSGDGAKSAGVSLEVTPYVPSSPSGIEAYFPRPGGQTLGVEISWRSFYIYASYVYLLATLAYQGNISYYRFKCDPTTGELWYLNRLNGDILIRGPVEGFGVFGVYHNMQIIFDYSKKEYVTANMDSYSYDLRGIGAYNITAAGEEFLYVSFIAQDAGAGLMRGYIDDVVITQNEAILQ